MTLKSEFFSGTDRTGSKKHTVSNRNILSWLDLSFWKAANQYCFARTLPPSGVLKLTGWLPGPLPRPLKVMTMRLYSEKGVRPGTVAWVRSPGNVKECLSPWLFFESTRLRKRHQFIYSTDRSFLHYAYTSVQWDAKRVVANKENTEIISVDGRQGHEKQTLRARSRPFLLTVSNRKAVF